MAALPLALYVGVMTNDKDKPFGYGFGFSGNLYDQRVTSHGQLGGITAHTVNLAPQDRRLDANMKAQLLQMVPKNMTVSVDSPMGDGEAAGLAQQVWDFLAASGYKMVDDGLAQTVRMPSPRGQGIDLTGKPGIAQVIIGSR